jgi:hypothetical protein
MALALGLMPLFPEAKRALKFKVSSFVAPSSPDFKDLKVFKVLKVGSEGGKLLLSDL